MLLAGKRVASGRQLGLNGRGETLEIVGPQLTDIDLLQVVVDYRCSRRCDYCYNSLLSQHLATESDRLVETLVDLLGKVRTPVEVELIGGEPLTGPAEVCSLRLLSLLNDHENCRFVTLSTAALEYPRWSDVLRRVDRVYLSIDIHGPSNGRNWKPLKFEPLRDLTAAARESGRAQVVTSTTLLGTESSGELVSFVTTLMQCGVTSMGFAHIAGDPTAMTRAGAYADLFYALFVIRLAMRESIDVGGAILENVEMALRSERRRIGCGCGITTLAVEPDGTLSPGVFFDHADRSPMEWAHFRAFHRSRTSDLLAREPCKSCCLREVCQGGCIGVALTQSPSGTDREQLFCEIQRHVYERVSEDLSRAYPSA